MPIGLQAVLPTATGAFAVSWLLVRLVRSLAIRWGTLDVPNSRSSHVRPTPRLGGLGILAAVVLVTGTVAARHHALTAELVVMLCLSASLSLISLLDDLRGLPAVGRLFVHLTIAATAVAWLGPLDIAVPGVTSLVASRVAAHVVTILWIAGFINAFNFMDGTDGIAAAQAVIAATMWALAGLWLGQPQVTILATAVAGASAGFLLHNWCPATIFMGDVGSAFLGFLLAALPLLVEVPRPLLTASLPVWPFVFDTTITLVRRAHRGENLLMAHRSHLYQRLTQVGWPHWQTAVLYSLLALAGATVATAMASGLVRTPLWGGVVLVVGPALLWMLVVWQESRHASAPLGVASARRSGDA